MGSPRDIRAILTLALMAAALLLAAPAASAAGGLDRDGMWIWYVADSSGGDPDAIAASAHAHGIGTVVVKSGDGTRFWGQFSSSLIRALHARGLKVCGWQYVYGSRPKDEARVAAHAVEKHADCFVIDAEAEYEGKYSSARKYMRKLRKAAGSHYPIALAGFPYVDYHPSFPYSVFLGPGGAQYNVPQAYWKLIGQSANTVLDHTYPWNRPYGRAMRPLGQLFDHPDRKQIMHFRDYVNAEGDPAVSWWDWQEATSSDWLAVGDPLSGFDHPVKSGYVTISKGDRGDIVYWAQQHLVAAGESLTADGDFGSRTKRAVKAFQTRIGLPASGKIDSATWTSLLSYSLKHRRLAKASVGGRVLATPRSARMHARRYEIPPPARRAH